MKKNLMKESQTKILDFPKMTLRGKPKCPWCEKPLLYVYSDAKEGHLNLKCKNCGKKVLLDLSTMIAYKIDDDRDIAQM
jgi:transcription elongation factor Elf1